MSTEGLFGRITKAFEQAGIEYMLTGSFASSYHGEPRATQDIDLVVVADTQQIRELARLLPDTEYYFDLDDALEAVRRRSMFNIIDLETGWKIDLIIRRPSPFELVKFQRRIAVEYNGHTLFIATAEDAIISKLEWSKAGESDRQLRDVAGILRMRDDLDRSYIEYWVEELQLVHEWIAAKQAAGLK